MASLKIVQRRAAVSLALVVLAGALVAGTGASATAAQDQAVIAGQTNTETTPTVLENTDIGDGLQGYGGTALGSSGVYGDGYAGVSGNGSTFGVDGTGPTGVIGTSNTAGHGVWGRSSGPYGSGVFGQNLGAGRGVTGRSQDGIGVLAKSGNGTALKVEGTVDLRRSGRTTVASGERYSQVTLADLSAKTFIIATVQGGAGDVWVQRVSVNPTNCYIRIYLNAAATANTQVGWFAID